MKIKITMKDPDVIGAVKDAVKESIMDLKGLSNSEKEAIIEVRQEEILNKIEQWFNYGEYLTVEVDTEANTCVVIKQNG